jgi:hypothetical protein
MIHEMGRRLREWMRYNIGSNVVESQFSHFRSALDKLPNLSRFDIDALAPPPNGLLKEI